MEMQDWTTPEYLANLAAEELSAIMLKLGISHLGCFGDEDGDVGISFTDIRDAEALMTLAFESDATPGSLYDRATTSCVTLGSYAANAERGGEDPSDEMISDAVDAGWVWVIHPNMQGRRMDWHVRVGMPHADAYQITSRLNTALLRGQS